MSDYMIHETINELGLESSFKIFYNFDNFSGNYINSLISGNIHSGEIINYNNNFHDTSSGSGHFDNQCIKISNTSGIQSKDATIIFSQEKTGISNGVLFSHLTDNNNGWELGINEANKLYFKNYVNNQIYYETLDAYMFDKNICGITVSNDGSVSIQRLNFNQPQASLEETEFKYYTFQYKDMAIPRHSIENGNEWYIGSGEFLYQGYMDCMLYFDTALSRESLRKISHAIYSNGYFVPEQSGFYSGIVTGYNKISSGVSGKIGTRLTKTGVSANTGFYTYNKRIPITGFAEISGEFFYPDGKIEYDPILNQLDEILYKRTSNWTMDFNISGEPTSTGLKNFRSSGDYWDFSGASGSFKGQTAIGSGDQIFAITGFNIIEETGYLTGYQRDLFSREDLSGIVYNEYKYEPKTGYSGYFLESRASTSGTFDYKDNEYFASAVSLIGEQNTDQNFYEIIIDIDESINVNNRASINFNFEFEKYIFKIDRVINKDLIIPSMNGVTQIYGDIEYSKDINNLPTYSVNSGIFITGSTVFSKIDIDFDDVFTYDYEVSGARDLMEINSIAEYQNAPFTDFNFEARDIYLNGVKIYSGTDYIDSGGFTPVGNSLNVVGVYHTTPKYSGAVYYTGENIQGKINHDSITPNKNIIFANGIRNNTLKLIEHARYSDLISGVNKHKNKEQILKIINGVKQL